jgi:acyl-CoA dehydrogenase
VPYPLNDTQRAMRQVIRDFCRNEVMPGAAERDRTGAFPAEIMRGLGELGAMGITVPDSCGGLGLDTQTQLLAIEEVARADAALASIYTAHLLALEVLVPYLNEEQKGRFIPEMASGKALTEPGSGSDIGGMDTVARRDGDAWVVSGSKTFISNAADADTTVLFAKTDPAAGFRGISAFVLSRGTPGVSFSEPQEKLGIRSAPTHTVYLDGVRVTDDRVIGELGTGGKMALSALNRARIDIAAMANGIAQRALELAVEYAAARVQFGHPIRDFQAIQLMLGEMDAELEVARLTAWWAAAEKDSGADLRRAGSIAKWVATENCGAIVDLAVQVHGGAGYMRESEIERLYRDARILRIFEGTSQIQLLGIAAALAAAFDRSGEVV